MLESAVQGGSGSSGTGSGRGERFGLAHLKADLETAADQLPLHWQATAWVFSRQHRYSVLVARRRAQSVTLEAIEPDEHPVPSVALDNVYFQMARSLGWQEGQAA